MAQSLSNLPIGAKIKFGKHSVNGETAQDITWLIVAKNHSSTPAYPSNSITLLTEKIIDLRAFDTNEPNNPYEEIRNGGNNDYGISNIDQWLNSSNSPWYSATHTYDRAPDNNYYGSNGTGYDSLPGFLSNFTVTERNVILNTNIRYIQSGYLTSDVIRKVFIPSILEAGIDTTTVKDGSAWSYFSTTANRRSRLTSQCFNNTQSTDKPYSETSDWNWWTRSASPSTKNSVFAIDNNGNESKVVASRGSCGVRPAMNLLSTLSVSDTTDSDGCYTPIFNSAPPVPTTLNVPTIYGGKSAAISWSKVTDPDGDTVTYQLEMATNGGEYSTIYSGTNLAYATIIPFGATSVQFRLKAVDSLGSSSGYITSTSRTVTNNNPPVISGTDGSLGTKDIGFTQTYRVTDANNNVVTVTESIDDTVIRSYVATLGVDNIFSVTGNTWLALANGIHTMTIIATDGTDSVVRTYTFTKSVSSFSVENTTAWAVATMPTRIKVTVNKTIPAEATLKIEVCNNGFDTSPVWEDATQSMNSGLVYLFSNTTKKATNWGVKIRVTVNRNGGAGACYISSIGGNFE